MKYFKSHFLFSLLALIAASPASAASQQANNVRIVEDVLWVAVFIIITLFAVALMKMTKGGIKEVYYGYSMFLLVGISGLIWKGLGLINRVALASQPKWLFSSVRETFEGLTGLILGIACLVLFIVLNKSINSDKS